MRSGARAITHGLTVLAVALLVPASAWAQDEHGSIVAWGNNWDGQCDVPAPNTDFVAVAAGCIHSLGLKADGSILAWGENHPSGACDVPEPNTDFVAVAAGHSHSLGLKADGSIRAWGENANGQCDVPEPNTDVLAIAGGWHHSLALRSDGSIAAWGDSYYGQCDVPSPNTGFVAVAAGAVHSLGLKADGSIVAWGWNEYGQCDVPEPNTGFEAVAAAWGSSRGLKADGSIAAWGFNEQGQCDVPEPNTDFVAVAAGGGWNVRADGHSLGLKADGTIVAWGAGECGESGTYDFGQSCVPEPNTGFVAIAADGIHSLGVRGYPLPPSPGITVEPKEGLVTTEAGGADTFSLVLETQPTAPVTVGLSSDDPSEGAVSPVSVTFDTDDWDVAQTVTVTGVDDAEADDDVAYAIVTAPAVSSDPDYAGLDADDVAVTNWDDEALPGPRVDAISPDTMQAGTSIGVTISGRDFASGAEVTFENGPGIAPAANMTSVNSRTIEAVVTAHRKAKDAVWDVRVTNPDGSSDVLLGGFTLGSPPPVCSDGACDPGEDECSCPADCGTPPTSETDCADGVDNDCDGLVDCDDTVDCADALSCACSAKGDPCTLDSDCCSNLCKRNGTCR